MRRVVLIAGLVALACGTPETKDDNARGPTSPSATPTPATGDPQPGEPPAESPNPAPSLPTPGQEPTEQAPTAPAPTPLPAPTPAPMPAPTPAPGPSPVPPFSWRNGKPMTFSGTGNKVIDATPRLIKGAIAFKVTATGDSNFIVKLGTMPESLIANEVLNAGEPFTGTFLDRIPDDGTYPIEVTSDGSWTLEGFVPEVLTSRPAKVVGKGAMVSAVFPLPGKQRLKFTATHNGTSNFIVHLVDASTGVIEDFIVNEIGVYTGDSLAQVSSLIDRHYLLSVEADGDWEIVITPL